MSYKFNKDEMLRFGLTRPTVDALQRTISSVVEAIGNTGSIATQNDLISLPDDGVSATTIMQQLQNQIDYLQAALLEQNSATSQLQILETRIDDLSMQLSMITFPAIIKQEDPLPGDSTSRISDLEAKLNDLSTYVYATSI